MGYIYVYSPFVGGAISLDCYCSEDMCGTGNNCPQNTPCGCGACTHPAVNYSSPLDISSGSINTVVYFRGSSWIESIRIEYDDVCATEGGDIDQGAIIHMYRKPNAQCPIGSIFYGHLRNRNQYIQNGQIINKPYYSNLTKSLGLLPSVPPGSRCYRGIHVHVSAQGGIRRTIAVCGSTVYTGTWIYKWYWNEGWC